MQEKGLNVLAEITLQHISIFCLCVTSFSSDDLLESVCCYYFEDGTYSESLNMKEMINMIILQYLR